MIKTLTKLILFIMLVILMLSSINTNEDKKSAQIERKPPQMISDGYIEELFVQDEQTQHQEVRFTSYHPQDGSSGTVTASGLSVDDFQTNANGWYTFENKIVLATATEHCTKLKKGVCGKYNSLPNGFRQYKLFDEITIEIEGIDYSAIVLDVCGASYWDEPLQRYDIFVKDKNSAYDGKGKVK